MFESCRGHQIYVDKAWASLLFSPRLTQNALRFAGDKSPSFAPKSKLMPRIKFHKTDDPYFGLSQESRSNKSIEEIIDSIESRWIGSPLNLEEIDVEPLAITRSKPIFASGIEEDLEEDFGDLEFSEKSKKQITEIFEKIAQILEDPHRIFHYLQSLDRALGERMAAQGIGEIDNRPQYLIAGVGNFIPGPWPENYRPLKKNKALDLELLEREQRVGLNLDGVGKFFGFVGNDSANEFVKEGHIFTENEHSSKFLFHGKYTHRLAFEVIRQAAQSGDLDLTIGNSELTQKQLLNLITFTWGKESGLMSWGLLLDYSKSAEAASKHEREPDGFEKRMSDLDPRTYDFNSRSPFIFRSLITCFGGDELPNLSSYLLDSHYKEVAQMIYKIRGGDFERKLDEVPYEFIYTCCMDAMSTGKEFNQEEITGDFPFLVEDKIENTQRFSSKYSKEIRRKNTKTEAADKIFYDSIYTYIEEKNGQDRPSRSPQSVADHGHLKAKTNDKNR